MADARTVAIVTLIAVAPVAVVLIVALVRGYTIDLHMERPHGRDRDRDE